MFLVCFMYVMPMYLLYVVAIQKIPSPSNILSGENLLSCDAHQLGRC
jgi:hypothetical protein